MARITKISIEGLFGVFDYEIPLNQDDRITILTGPNGFGKTSILNMIDVFSSLWKLSPKKIEDLYKGLPSFRKFTISFESNLQIAFISDHEVNREQQSHNYKTDRIVIGDHEDDMADEPYRWHRIFDIIAEYPTRDNSLRYTAAIGRIEYYIGFGPEVYRESDVQFIVEKVMTEHEGEPCYLYSRAHKDMSEVKRLRDFLEGLSTEFIKADRLLAIRETYDKDHDQKSYQIQAKIEKYASDLAQVLAFEIRRYGEVAQRLDRSYPVRVMERSSSVDTHKEHFIQEFQSLRELRNRLAAVSVMDDTDHTEIKRLEAALATDNLDIGTKNMLEVYISDSQEKYGVFANTLRKLELFQAIINRKLAYSHKQITFSRESGFLISYKRSKDSKYPQGPIPLTTLSSGEQHQIILFYELLFEVKPKSLVLIDEPELSLHLSWQVDFLEDLQEISRLADLDFLIATHAPSIIEDRWDLVVELEG